MTKALPVCEVCNQVFATASTLRRHQKTVKSCGSQLGTLLPKASFLCEHCGGSFTRKDGLRDHQRKCKALEVRTRMEKSHQEAVAEINRVSSAKISALESTVAELRQDPEKEYMRGKLDAMQEINKELVGLDKAKTRVIALEKKYLRKRPRELYPEKYVVYLITNQDIQARKVYIIGSATSLTERLTTYNKSAEHSVIHYSACGDKTKMKAVEQAVLVRLGEHREQANRDRFVLPEGRDIQFFVDIIKSANAFFSNS